MKSKMYMLFMLLAMALPATIFAQNSQTNDSHYLKGAVPEVNGKVVFSHEYVVAGLSKEDIYNKVLDYLNARMSKNENVTSRVAYANKEEGVIAALADEWIVFSQKALSLDRTKIKYQVTANCSDGKCEVLIAKILYTYREKEKYQAEEWISDKYALNKAQTKLVRGLAKWRRKTIDLVDTYFKEIGDVLGSPVAEKAVQQVQQVQQVKPAAKVGSYRSVSPTQIPADVLSVISRCKVVVTIGTDDDNMTTITANKGVALGTFNNKPVVFVSFDASQQVSALENAKNYTLKFINQDNKQVIMITECSPVTSSTADGIKIFTGQINKAMVAQ